MINDKEQLVRDLAATGKLRATIHLGNVVLAQRNEDGALGGVSVDLARELASELGVEAEFHPFDTAGAAFEALKSRACDIGFSPSIRNGLRISIHGSLCHHRGNLSGARDGVLPNGRTG